MTSNQKFGAAVIIAAVVASVVSWNYSSDSINNESKQRAVDNERKAVLREFQDMEVKTDKGGRMKILEVIVRYGLLAESDSRAFELEGWFIEPAGNPGQWRIGVAFSIAGERETYAWRYDVQDKSAVALNAAAANIKLFAPQ